MNCNCGKELLEDDYLEVSGYNFNKIKVDVDGDIIKVPMCKECIKKIMSHVGFDNCENCGKFRQVTEYPVDEGTTDPTSSDYGSDGVNEYLCSECIKTYEDYGNGK